MKDAVIASHVLNSYLAYLGDVSLHGCMQSSIGWGGRGSLSKRYFKWGVTGGGDIRLTSFGVRRDTSGLIQRFDSLDIILDCVHCSIRVGTRPAPQFHSLKYKVIRSSFSVIGYSASLMATLNASHSDPVPDMTYNVFGGDVKPYSINQSRSVNLSSFLHRSPSSHPDV